MISPCASLVRKDGIRVHPDNPGLSSYFEIFNLITFAVNRVPEGPRAEDASRVGLERQAGAAVCHESVGSVMAQNTLN